MGRRTYTLQVLSNKAVVTGKTATLVLDDDVAAGQAGYATIDMGGFNVNEIDAGTLTGDRLVNNPIFGAAQAIARFLGYIAESTQDAITAHAGGGQGAAQALINEINRMTVVATAGDSVLLPASAAGLTVVVINSGANQAQVYGSGADTINDQAAATGVFQAPNSVETYYCPVAGKWYADLGAGFSGSLFTETAQDNITARAGGGQALATQLTSQTSRVTVVASAGDSVKLPASAPGLEVMVINHGANSMQVFGAGTDTIDDIATATGVPQMPNSVVIYVCAAAGAWYSEGLATGFAGPGLQSMSFATGLTANAGGGQAGALLLAALVNRIATVATPADSVKLPASAAGLSVLVTNNGANDMQVFGSGTDTIDGVATATGVSQPSGTTVTYTCYAAGAWVSSIAAANSFGLARTTEAETLVADANAAVTAAQLLKGFLRSIPTAARTWTLDTAANIDALIPAVKIGHSFQVSIFNNSAGAFAIGFTAGAGLTFFPAGGVSIAQNKTATLTFLRTGAGAWNVYHQVGA